MDLELRRNGNKYLINDRADQYTLMFTGAVFVVMFRFMT